MSTGNAALCDQQKSVLVAVDLQERLLAAMPAMDAVLQRSALLLHAARLLDVPLLSTTQYARGLGAIHPKLLEAIPAPIDKTGFSCVRAPEFAAQLEVLRRPQVVLCGVEAHVCILQTAMDLLARGMTLFIVEDAVASRDPLNKRNALCRLRAAGAWITNSESVIFEWLRDARHDHFKALSGLLR